MFLRALKRGLLLAAVPVALAPASFVAPVAAASPDVDYAAGTTQMEAALFAAKVYWGADPCAGKVDVTWADLGVGINALSHWTTFAATAYGAPESNTDCLIEFNRTVTYDWPMLCSVAVHEVGHLVGHDHVATPGQVM